MFVPVKHKILFILEKESFASENFDICSNCISQSKEKLCLTVNVNHNLKMWIKMIV